MVRETEGIVVSLRSCADGGRDMEQAVREVGAEVEEQEDTGFRKDGGGARWHYPHVWTMLVLCSVGDVTSMVRGSCNPRQPKDRTPLTLSRTTTFERFRLLKYN